MMKEKSGKVCRNIQEQVQKNMEDIVQLKRRTPVDSFVQHLSTDEKSVLNIEQNEDGESRPYSIYLGSNLLLNSDGKGNFTLSASGQITGNVPFVDITGNPTDNLKLKPYLENNAKINERTDITGFYKFLQGIGIENSASGYYLIMDADRFVLYLKDGTAVTLIMPKKSGTLATLDDIPEYTPVIANPDGKPTADLTSIAIEGVIYSIPGGGASSFAQLEGNPRDNKALAAELDKYIEEGTWKNVGINGNFSAGAFISGKGTASITYDGGGIHYHTATEDYDLLMPRKSGTLATLGDVQGTFKLLGGSPYDNTQLAGALNSKADRSALDAKQNKTDNTLETVSKDVVGAINEVNSKATGQVIAYQIDATTKGNEPFNNSSDYLIIATSFVDTNGFVHQSAELKATDIVIVLNEGIPSRVYTGNNTYMKQTTVPELDDYYTKEQTNALLMEKVDYETLGKDVEGEGFRTAAAQDAIDSTKQDVIKDLETIRQDSLLGATAVQPEQLDPINEHLDSHDKSISKAEVDIGNLQNSVGTLTETVGNHDTAIVNMQNTITALGNEKADKKELDPIKENITALQTTTEGHTTELGNLTTDVKNVKEVQDAHDLRIYELEQNKQDKITTTQVLLFTLEDGSEVTTEVYTKE